MTEQPISQREFDVEKFATRREFDQLLSRVDGIDQGGTRGVVALQAQLVDLAKDVSKLEATVDNRFANVDAKFERQRQERVTGRRWLIGVGIAGLASMSTVITMLYEVLTHIH